MPRFKAHSVPAFPLAALMVVVVAGLLAGCAANEQDSTARFLVAPGKYVLFNCKEIKQTADENAKRQHELEELMAKAGSDSAGRLVSAVAYKPEYYELRGRMADLRQAAADKKCKFVPSAARSATPVGVPAVH